MRLRILGITRRLLRPEEEGFTIGRTLALGALVWGMYTVVQMLVRGVALDEVVVAAQIIAGAVRYPPGHPHQIFYTHAYNLPHYLAAGVWAAFPSALLISALRNFFFLFSSTFVPFAVAALLTRQLLWGHVAATLTLSEAILPFQGNYPLWVFPHFYSHGHIGMHAAILVVVLLLAGLWRTGGVLLGILPSLHPAMAIIVWPWSACYFLLTRGRQLSRDRRRLMIATSLGVAICAALVVIILYQTVTARVQPPYDAQANADLIQQRFTAMTDGHNKLFPVRSFAYLVNPIAFFAIGALLLGNIKKQQTDNSNIPRYRDHRWILLLGGFVWTYIYGAWLYQKFIGPLPHYINISRPFRFSNLTALLLIPITVAAIAYAQKAMTGRLYLLGMALVTGLVLAEGVLITVDPVRFYDYLIFVTWGVLFAMGLYAYWRERKRLIVCLIAFVALGSTLLFMFMLKGSRAGILYVASFTVSCLLVGVGVRLSRLLNLDQQRWDPWLRRALVSACLATSVAALPAMKVWDAWSSNYDQAGHKLERWDVVTQYDLQLREWLLKNADSDEILLSSLHYRTELQIKTDHPVLMEMETLYLMTYKPSLAPAIGTMVRDIFEIDYTDQDQLARLSRNGQLAPGSPVWHDSWKKRRLKEWQSLGRKYKFRLVLSPSNTPLDLPIGLSGPLLTLYVIP